MPRVADRPPARVLVAIGLVAGTTLALQVLLTRLFAALFYHFSFLAISLGLLGTGGGAILVYVRRRGSNRPRAAKSWRAGAWRWPCCSSRSRRCSCASTGAPPTG